MLICSFCVIDEVESAREFCRLIVLKTLGIYWEQYSFHWNIMELMLRRLFSAFITSLLHNRVLIDREEQTLYSLAFSYLQLWWLFWQALYICSSLDRVELYADRILLHMQASGSVWLMNSAEYELDFIITTCCLIPWGRSGRDFSCYVSLPEHWNGAYSSWSSCCCQVSLCWFELWTRFLNLKVFTTELVKLNTQVSSHTYLGAKVFSE